MPIICNNLSSRILIHINGSKYIDLLEKTTAEVTDDDLLSSHLQGLIQRGFVNIGNEVKREVKEEESQRPSKEKEVNTEETAQKPSKEKEVNTEETAQKPCEENAANIEEK